MKALELPAGVKERLERHAFVVKGPLTHPYESMHMGNGDIGASVNIYPHELKLTLAKADVWDARYDGRPEEAVLKHDDLIRMMQEKDRDLVSDFKFENAGEPGGSWDFRMESGAYGGPPYHTGPAPKRVGCVRIYHPGLSNTEVDSRLDILTGVLETRFHFGAGSLVIRSFIERTAGRIWVEAESCGHTPWFAIIVEKEPDDADRSIPMPDLRAEGGYAGCISQTIPAGFGIDAFRWSLAASFPAPDEGVDAYPIETHAYRFRQYCSLGDGMKTRLCLAVATSRDGTGDTQARALEAARSMRPKFEEAFRAHTRAWEQFWAKSSVQLDDAELESVWYRNHFGYGCTLRPGMTPLGSGGNVVVRDSLPWHGDCHMNHNFQKWFVTALPVNHPEWIDVYADFIAEKMPVFEYQAGLIFGLEGAYCDLLYFPVMAREHCHINNYMGRSLAITGWLGQPLWWHWEYMQDKQWLKDRAYPYLKKAAQFYWNYLEKYQDESGDIYPSIRIEEPGWTKGFRGNRNVISDLVMFRKAFEWAIAAAKALEVDEDWVGRWEDGIKRVPPIEYGWADGEGWVALDKHWRELPPAERADLSRSIRWAGGGWAVFPGEYVAGDGDDGLTQAFRDMIARTDLKNPYYSTTQKKNKYPGVPIIHPISSILPAIRLGVRKHYDAIRDIILSHRMTYGQTSSYMLTGPSIPREIEGYSGYIWYDWRSVENKYLGVIAITEMLLQSQGSALRLFPFWPGDRSASFGGLRARGGFLVSAALDGGTGRIAAEIESLAGRPCRIRCDGAVTVSIGGEPVASARHGGDVVFDTARGRKYTVTIG